MSGRSGQEQSSEGSQEDKGMDPCDQPPSATLKNRKNRHHQNQAQNSGTYYSQSFRAALGSTQSAKGAEGLYVHISSSSEMCS